MNLQWAGQISGRAMTFDQHLLVVLLILVATGVLGGVANYFLRDRAVEAQQKDWIRYPVLGLVAALTVPLVLSMLSSNLIDAGRTNAGDYLVLAGFSVLYVVLSRRLFDNSLNRLMAKTEKLNKDIARLSQQVVKIEQAPASLPTQTAQPVSSTQANEGTGYGNVTHQTEPEPVKKEVLTHADVELLRAIAQDDIVYGNLADLVDRTGVSRESVSHRVAVLKSWGALDTRMNDRQVLQWIVTPKGRQMLADLIR